MFLRRYALRDLQGRLREFTPEQMWDRVAGFVARAEGDRPTWRACFRELLAGFRFVPGGRILFGAGNPRRVTLFNCYYVPIREDSVAGITRWMVEAARTYAAGGGVGTNVDVLRPRGAATASAGLVASGPVSFMEVFSALTGVMGSVEGRRGALMMTLRVDHPDVLEFVRAKSDPQRIRVQHANVSLRVPDEFFSVLDADADLRLWFRTPRELVERRVPARRIWEAVVEAAWASAEPGLLFWDTVVRESTAQYGGLEVEGVNVCGEVPMEPYGACNLGSVNLGTFVREPFGPSARMDWSALEEAVQLAVRFLDDVVTVGAPRHPLRAQREASERSRRVGLGVMGLADALAMLGVVYGSEESVRWVEQCFRRVRDSAYAASVELAKEKGTFPVFDATKHERSPFIQRLPAELRRAIRRWGLRNAALLAIAPTGTISLLAGASSGIEPIFGLRYTRLVGGRRVWAEHPLLALYRGRTGREDPDWPTAHQVDPLSRVRLQAAAQQYVDQSISSTVNLPASAGPEVVEAVYRSAWEMGCKGITVFREGSRTAILEAAGTSPVAVCTLCEPGLPADGPSAP
ncbi:MAG: adenosylcobalamin-dependent ribonucleoside-diphosphate reductase [bacterium]